MRTTYNTALLSYKHNEEIRLETPYAVPGCARLPRCETRRLQPLPGGVQNRYTSGKALVYERHHEHNR